MKIALYGYGKMGKAIEAAAQARGHEVVLRVDAANAGTAPTGADVAIEFSRPDQALANMKLCLEHGVPVVVGTTGWYDHLGDVRTLVSSTKGGLLWASNFSIGVNLFFRVNRQLARLMDPYGYNVHIHEVHHIHKLDAPSGTAISLAKDIDLNNRRYAGYALKEQAQDQEAPFDPSTPLGAGLRVTPSPVFITAERTGEVPGTHSVTWTSADDRIVITHEAFSRKGFATGAVVAAEWLRGRTGLFTMDDVLDAS